MIARAAFRFSRMWESKPVVCVWKLFRFNSYKELLNVPGSRLLVLKRIKRKKTCWLIVVRAASEKAALQPSRPRRNEGTGNAETNVAYQH